MMEVQNIEIEKIIPYENNPRKNNETAVGGVAKSILEFGFTNPILVDENFVVVAGHTRLLAAKSLKLPSVPVVVLKNKTQEQIIALRILDNKLHELSDWDYEKLEQEMLKCAEIDISLFNCDFGYLLEGEEVLNKFRSEMQEKNIDSEAEYKVKCPSCSFEFKP